eukprot:CAMPEP_0174832680 /NCGR_PEP_ID=MMETSP1114-20130205/3800_1 /TAXON_ID=312471 /ORGANISM="Neobodo designis, Strain CCAP 1951/1" /LENGTH=318 /DNA_ID=CAMNT_0016066543 /DNA_START=61 /DNA_END=1017 /DNA_ORIENTATION=-
MPEYAPYPVGTPGTAWSDAEKQQWRARQAKQRDYFADVVSPLSRVQAPEIAIFQYGMLDYREYGAAAFPLFGAKSADWRADRPMVSVTGGVHGYETSGVLGALHFVQNEMARVCQLDKVNVVVLPCVSPWGYETINRWTPAAFDPNRAFTPANPGCPEAAAAMPALKALAEQSSGHVMHLDLHETTDTDNSEFRPALFARDGKLPYPAWDPIPDGFFVVADPRRGEAQLPFVAALIDAVSKVTHIADADENGNVCGLPPTQRGVVSPEVDGICGSHTGARFCATTEVYPDSKRTNPDECNKAQVQCVVAGIDYALGQL